MLLLIALALGADAFVLEPRALVLHRERLVLPEWTGPSLRIALLSDIHVGAPFIDAAKVDDIITLTNAQQPDLVVLLGDYVVSGDTIDEWVRVAPALRRLKSRLGTYAILGNHDWWTAGEAVRISLQQAGIPVLENSAVPIRDGQRTFWLWGLAEVWTRRVDYSGPLKDIPEGAPIIALSHNPDVFPSIQRRVALTLAGHTHGGQVWLPLLGRPIVPSKYGERYAAGLVAEEGHHLYVTTGIGTSVLPVRFRVPPEVAVLDLSGGP